MGVYMHVQCHVFSIELWHYIIIYALFMHTIVVSKFKYNYSLFDVVSA